MDLDNAAAFMLGTIGYGAGVLVMIAVVVVINNIIAKYWKPIQFFKWAEHPATRFATEEEIARIAPEFKK